MFGIHRRHYYTPMKLFFVLACHNLAGDEGVSDLGLSGGKDVNLFCILKFWDDFVGG